MLGKSLESAVNYISFEQLKEFPAKDAHIRLEFDLKAISFHKKVKDVKII